MAYTFEFVDFQEESVRIIVDEQNVAWWILTDVCRVLGYVNSRDVLSRIPESGRKIRRQVVK
jgi:prophage antirepressor-like protein